MTKPKKPNFQNPLHHEGEIEIPSYLIETPSIEYKENSAEALLPFIREKNSTVDVKFGGYKIIPSEKNVFYHQPPQSYTHEFPVSEFHIHNLIDPKKHSLFETALESNAYLNIYEFLALTIVDKEEENSEQHYETFFNSITSKKELIVNYITSAVWPLSTPIQSASKNNINILKMVKSPKETNEAELWRSLFYAGSKFSPFLWHTEDSYSYSLNILHEGAPKIWFFISPNDFKNFVNLILRSGFEKINLSNFLTPEFIIQNNIEVQYLIQYPNEIVVTRPKGYHAGFSIGQNWSEAINFQFPEDLEFNLEFDLFCQKQQKKNMIIDRLPQFNTGSLIFKTLNGRKEYVKLLPNFRKIISDLDKVISIFLKENMEDNDEMKQFLPGEAVCSECVITLRFIYAKCSVCNNCYCYIHLKKTLETCCQENLQFHAESAYFVKDICDRFRID